MVHRIGACDGGEIKTSKMEILLSFSGSNVDRDVKLPSFY